MRRSRIRWAAAVVTPWCLGVALLLSITPEAGQGAPIGGTFLPLSMRAPAMPIDLVPSDALALATLMPESDVRLLPVRYAVGSASELLQVPDELEPRAERKSGATPAPIIDRAHKGDPAVGLRPTFDTSLRRPGGLSALRASQLIAPHDDALPAASFSLGDNGGPLDGATSFSAWGDDEKPEDTMASGERQIGAAIAMQPAAFKERLHQGATPRVGRAEALASTTPAPADGAPVLASFSAPLPQAPNLSLLPGTARLRPNFAALLGGERGARERKCLAEAVYFEARSEPEEGQAAVAQVVLNRATSGLYPSSVCGVVYQNRTHYKACQFSFACEGKALRVTESEAWRTAERIANEVVAGKTYLSDVGGATHYHAKYVRPGWARRLVKMDVIGHHVFYKLRPGQT